MKGWTREWLEKASTENGAPAHAGLGPEGENAFGEYYIVETDGRIGLYDEDGQILLMERDSP